MIARQTLRRACVQIVDDVALDGFVEMEAVASLCGRMGAWTQPSHALEMSFCVDFMWLMMRRALEHSRRRLLRKESLVGAVADGGGV